VSEAPYPEYEGLLALAAESLRRDGPFIDPVKMRMYEHLGRDRDWRLSVLADDRSHGNMCMHVLLMAKGQGIDPPMPARLAAQRAEQAEAERVRAEKVAARVRALDEAWASIWKALPQRIGVAYNYSGGMHYESYQSGAVHIILTEDLKAGRVSRVKGGAMCTTPSSAQHQIFADAGDPPEQRRATCKACLRTAAKVAGVELPEILLTQERY
jgi:hypothetical protein